MRGGFCRCSPRLCTYLFFLYFESYILIQLLLTQPSAMLSLLSLTLRIISYQLMVFRKLCICTGGFRAWRPSGYCSPAMCDSALIPPLPGAELLFPTPFSLIPKHDRSRPIGPYFFSNTPLASPVTSCRRCNYIRCFANNTYSFFISRCSASIWALTWSRFLTWTLRVAEIYIERRFKVYPGTRATHYIRLC